MAGLEGVDLSDIGIVLALEGGDLVAEGLIILTKLDVGAAGGATAAGADETRDQYTKGQGDARPFHAKVT
jgi:hypothetical protein